MKKKLVFMIIFILAVIASTIFFLNKEKEIEVEAFKSRKGEVNRTIEETGTIKSRLQREISANTSGQVLKVMYEIGDKVNPGDVLLTLDMKASEMEIKSLQAKLNGILPSYNQAKRNTENSKNLYDQGAISYEEYQNTLTLEKQLQSQISELDYMIEQLKEMKDFGDIVSPIGGVVTEIYAREGEAVLNGSPLVEVADLEDLYVDVELLTSEANEVFEGAPVTLESEDLGIIMPNGGIVKKIHPKAHTKVSDLGIEQKRVTVEVDIEDMSAFKLGYDVDVEILTKSKKDILIIPGDVIFDKNGMKYVFVVKEGTAELRQIETGIENSEFIEVTSGINENELVIISPEDIIEEGSKITITSTN